MKLHDIKIKLLTKTAKIPTLGSAKAAGQDLYADESMVIEPGQVAMLSTGVAMAIPSGMVGLIFSRSGMVAKRGLVVGNGVGVIDSDYRGEWKVLLHNISAEPQLVEAGERIAQVVFLKHKRVGFMPVQDLEDTVRGAGGFGSTGTK